MGSRGDTGAGSTDTERRHVRRRLDVPSGRAVIGALLVAVAVIGLFVAADRGEASPTSSAVVVTEAIAPGQTIRADSVTAVAVTLPPELSASVLADPALLVGAVALAPLAPGDVVLRSAVRLSDGIDGDEGVGASLEVALQLPAHRVLDGHLQRGERVDLVATLGPTGEACTEVIVSGATVAALGRPGDELLRAADELTITLAMSSMNDVLAAVHASDQGDLTLVRATNVGDPAPGADSSYGSAASFCSGERGAAG